MESARRAHPEVAVNSVAEMRAAVLFDGETAASKTSRFWILLALSAVIAAAGVVADSTATVIGAMIVAPLMTPILGVVLATVLGDRANVARSWLFVIGGAALAVAIGYAVGLATPTDVVAASNSQVSGRVSPHLIDLLAALATGVVGAIALIRKDISDTLPGVAIAISLVPPLSVVGLTLEAQAWEQSLGALLLFVTNVAAILATGVIVFLLYRVGMDHPPTRTPSRTSERPGRARYRPVVTMLIAVVVIGIPLTASSVRVTAQSAFQSQVSDAVDPWAEQNGWEVVGTRQDSDTMEITLTGAPPVPATADLTQTLEEAGVDTSRVRLIFVPAYEVDLSREADG